MSVDLQIQDMVIVDFECSSTSKIPYVAATCSLKYGKEVFWITDGMPSASLNQLQKIKTPYATPCSLDHFIKTQKQRSEDGSVFWAFGSNYETQTLGFQVHELQRQKQFLITRGQDAGFPHNAYDEVQHYHSILLRQYPSNNLSWFEARNEPEKLEEYNALLLAKGESPVCGNKSFSRSAYGPFEWKHLLCHPVCYDHDVDQLKNQLYLDCIKQNLTRKDFAKLCHKASQYVPEKYRPRMSDNSFDHHLFPAGKYESNFEQYAKDADGQLEFERPNKINDTSVQLSTKARTSLLNQVRNGDIKSLRTIDDRFVGVEEDYDWTYLFGIFFKKIKKQQNVFRENEKHAKLDDAWDSISEYVTPHAAFVLRKSDCLDPAVSDFVTAKLRHFMSPQDLTPGVQDKEKGESPEGSLEDSVMAEQQPGQHDDQIYSGRSKKGRNLIEVDPTGLRSALLREFPESGQCRNYEDGVFTSFRLNATVLQAHDMIYQLSDSNLKAFATPNDLCVWSSLAHMAIYEQHDHKACEESYYQAVATVKPGTQGHTIEVIQRVCKKLKINLMSIRDLEGLLVSIRQENWKNKRNEWSAPLFPALLLEDNHCSLVSENFSSKKFTYRQLAEAFEIKEEPEQLLSFKTQNCESIKISKLKKSFDKERMQHTLEKERISSDCKKRLAKRVRKAPSDPTFQLRCQLNYQMRQHLKICDSKLPQEHPDDSEVALFCMKYQLGIFLDNIVPPIRSQTSYVLMASMQKKKNPNVFQKNKLQQIQTYKLNEEIKGKYETILAEKKSCEPDPQFQDQVFEGRQTQSITAGTALRKEFRFEWENPDNRSLENLKHFNQNVVSNAGPDMILATYCGINGNPVVNKLEDMNKNPFITSSVGVKHTFDGVVSLSNRPTKVNIQGALPNVFFKWMSMYGADLAVEQQKDAAHTSGGHTALRTAMNLGIAKQTDQIVERIHTPTIDANDDASLIIVAVGDKFAKTTNLLNRSCRWTPNLLHRAPTDQNDAAGLAVHQAFLAQWQQCIDNVKTMPVYNRMTNHQRDQAFLRQIVLHLPLEQRDPRVIALLRGRRAVKHVAVRPKVNPYDVEYWEQNLEKTVNIAWQPGYIDHEYREGYIQDNDDEYPDDRVIYWMTDVHYYLHGWEPTNQKEQDWYTALGGNFSHIPGEYILPFNEGFYIVTGTGEIKMKTRGSGLYYTHPHVALRNISELMSFGWYDIAHSKGNPKHFEIYKYEATNYSTTHSIQSTYLRTLLEIIKGYETSKIQTTQLRPSLTQEDAQSFFTALETNHNFKIFNRDMEVQLFSYFRVHPSLVKDNIVITQNAGLGNTISRLFYGPQLKYEKQVTVCETDKKFYMSKTTDQLLQLRIEERADPRNQRGWFNYCATHCNPDGIAVPHMSSNERKFVREENGEAFQLPNCGFYKQKRYPDVINKLTDLNSDENAQVYCGRKQKSEEQKIEESPKVEKPPFESKRGQNLLNDVMVGECAENIKSIQQRYIQQAVTKKNTAKKAKIKILKDSRNCIQVKDYFKNKKPDREAMKTNNPNIVANEVQYNRQMGALESLLDRHKEQMIIHKNSLLNQESFNKDKVVSKSGSCIVNENTGNMSQEYEWTTKSLNNTVCAFLRHTAPRQEPDNQHLADFDGMCERYLESLCKEILSENPQPQHNFMDYPASQKSWPENKIQTYERNLMNTFFDKKYGKLLRSFVLKVKSGEVYSTERCIYDGQGNLCHRSDRPRAIMNPTEKSFGSMQAIQREFFPLLKKHIPGFIHSQTTKETLDVIKGKISADWKAISIDGSAFDSSQFSPLMRSVDNRFWKLMSPFIKDILKHNWDSFSLCPTVTLDDLHQRMMEALLQTKNVVFIQVPTVNAPDWPERIRQQFFTDVSQTTHWKNNRIENDWVYFEIEGTTFSGHATRTTLGNTLRSLCYAWYYQMICGISQTPWDSDLVFTMAAGDDVVMFVHPDWVRALRNTVRAHTTENTNEQSVGLGQCVKEIHVGMFYEIEFCSKWSFCLDGTLENWFMCRDVKKLLQTKQFFTGKNKHILLDPYLHRHAIYLGIKSEKLSLLIQDIIQMQRDKLTRPEGADDAVQEIVAKSDYVKYGESKASGYNVEHLINQKLRKSIADLWILKTSDTIYCGRQSRSPSVILSQYTFYTQSLMRTKNHNKQHRRSEKSKVKKMENAVLSKVNRKIQSAKPRSNQAPADFVRPEQYHKVRRPNFSKGQLQQSTSTKGVLTAWDEMLVAKAHPGQFNPNYVAGMNNTNLPTSSFSVCNSFSAAYSPDEQYIHLGMTNYTLLMWSPSCTAFSGTGNGTNGNIAKDTKLGGFVVASIKGTQAGDAFVCRQLFQKQKFGLTMEEVYGSSMNNFSSGGFVWASEATVNILTPQANLVGAYYKGTLQFGALPDTQATGLTLNQLIEIAGDAEITKAQFHMRAGVVNHEIVYDSQQVKGEFVNDSHFAGELVNFVILQDTAINVTTGDPAIFGLQLNIKGNTVFWGNPKDAIANNLFKTNRDARSPMPGMLAGIGQNPLAGPRQARSLWEGAKHMLSKAWDNRETIATVAQNIAPMLMLDEDSEEDTNEPVAIKVNYMNLLEGLLEKLNSLAEQNPTISVLPFQQSMSLEYQRVRTYPGRLVPLEAETPQEATAIPSSRSSSKTKSTAK